MCTRHHGQRAPSAERCIAMCRNQSPPTSCQPHQKAQSTKRCIKTSTPMWCVVPTVSLRKHRAQKGALRQFQPAGPDPYSGVVRKHRAPKGALRLQERIPRVRRLVIVREHRAPKGALRRVAWILLRTSSTESESTERQKVH